jgi:uncharacterized protein YrrD
MSLGKELLNKPIFTIDEGKQIGKVQDLYLDDSLEVVLGLFVGSQGLVRRKSELIRSGDVVVFGVDAVLVRSDDVITDDSVLPAAKSWVRREKVIGREVDTPGGTRLGLVGDVIVDATGRVTGLALSKAFVEGPLAEKRVIDRSVIIDTGHQDGRMTVDLHKLEATLAGAVPLPPEPVAELPIIVEEPPAPDEPPAEG